jgi:uncharacterized OB-fold protein
VSAARQIPIAEGLFSWPSEEPRLIGSKCADCGEVTFPAQTRCPACPGSDCREVPLSARGTLWTWTIQNFPPPVPYAGDVRSFVPFGVGYIELPEGVRIEARLTENDADCLRIGMDMELVIEKFADGEDGAELMTFAFRPLDP